jgi:methionine synthase I (cobalamin-dependent)
MREAAFIIFAFVAAFVVIGANFSPGISNAEEMIEEWRQCEKEAGRSCSFVAVPNAAYPEIIEIYAKYKQ